MKKKMKKIQAKRKGKITKEVALPDGVSASVNGTRLLIKGPKGEVKRELRRQSISITVDNHKILFESKSETKRDKKIIGALAAHARNMVNGCLQNHNYTIKICSGHFPMNVSISSGKLIVKNFLGEKVPRVLHLKEGANVKVEGDLIYVTSASKELAGQVTADIEKLTRRPGYDSRIFQDGCYIIIKDGRELK
ncbi:50S ribosomal protein L6 [Candidatus Woesearchaeota archaeon]|nr:50S ribosomal protein L6 [Candidatus Woesearchaeota archaeon]